MMKNQNWLQNRYLEVKQETAKWPRWARLSKATLDLSETPQKKSSTPQVPQATASVHKEELTCSLSK